MHTLVFSRVYSRVFSCILACFLVYTCMFAHAYSCVFSCMPRVLSRVFPCILACFLVYTRVLTHAHSRVFSCILMYLYQFPFLDLFYNCLLLCNYYFNVFSQLSCISNAFFSSRQSISCGQYSALHTRQISTQETGC